MEACITHPCLQTRLAAARPKPGRLKVSYSGGECNKVLLYFMEILLLGIPVQGFSWEKVRHEGTRAWNIESAGP
jgi:hypothetical protein